MRTSRWSMDGPFRVQIDERSFLSIPIAVWMPTSFIDEQPNQAETMSWKDKNFGKHPDDPDFDPTYDAEADREAYETAREEKEQARREQ